jgi:hypothetical protein
VNILPFDNTLTGETQEQCACCKQWGWPKEELVKFTGNHPTVYLCVKCCPDVDNMTPEAGWTAAQAAIAKGTPMEDYLAEAKAELTARSFNALKRRIGL